MDLTQWLVKALDESGIEVIALRPDICVESTRLPGEFHRDPADQIIVATARVLACPLVSMDRLIRAYPHVSMPPQLRDG